MESSWMTTKPRPLATLQRLLALGAEKLSTMLEPAPSTEPNRSNPSGNPVPKVEVLGCPGCGAIYDRHLYFSNLEEKETEYCPECGGVTEYLGPLPFYVGDVGEDVYLGGQDGTITGPYSDQVEAQRDLWAWFRKWKEHAHQSQDCTAQGPRLIAREGVIIHPRGAAHQGPQEEGCPQTDEEAGPESRGGTGDGNIR